MKYKVGDKVKVRSDLEAGKNYGLNNVVTNMLPFCGKIVTIECISNGQYCIKGSSYDWTDEMFEDIVPKYKIGDKVQVIETLDDYSIPGSNLIVSNMLIYAKKIVTISKINFISCGIAYNIKEDNGAYYWPESTLEPVKVINSDYIPCVGDKVLIREDLIPGKYYNGTNVVKDMCLYCNRILTVTKVNPNEYINRENQFTVAENSFIWSSEMVKMKVQDDFNPELPSKEKNTLPEVEEELFLVIPKTKPKLFII